MAVGVMRDDAYVLRTVKQIEFRGLELVYLFLCIFELSLSLGDSALRVFLCGVIIQKSLVVL